MFLISVSKELKMKTFAGKRQLGSSMLEIVITIFIISIGLLGLGAMQINAMKFQKSSSQRSEATQSAYDLSERIRANRQGAVASDYVYTTAYAATVLNLPNTPECTDTKCTSNEIARIDLAQWLRNLNSRLHGGAGYVIKNSVGGYDVTVMWREQNGKVSSSDLDPACPNEPLLAPGAGVSCYMVRFVP
jgi:type IV pilus assembly protein PilV